MQVIERLLDNWEKNGGQRVRAMKERPWLGVCSSLVTLCVAGFSLWLISISHSLLGKLYFIAGTVFLLFWAVMCLLMAKRGRLEQRKRDETSKWSS